MNSFAEALNNVNIKPVDFEDRVIDENKIECEMEIDFLEKWLKMLERNASEKEKYNFIIKHGFLSVKHFNMYMACKDDAVCIRFDIEGGYLTDDALKEKERELKEKENLMERIKNINYYKFIMKMMGEKDFSPYGVNLLRT
jgi:hypothetical protein